MKRLKKLLSVFLAFCMVVGMAFAVPNISSAAGWSKDSSKSSESLYKIVHLDAGRKYFSVESIKNIIDTMKDAGYNYLELAVGNDGMRFLLDDMTLTVGEQTYESDAVKTAIQNGNRAYSDFGTNELTQGEMDEIIAYAAEKGIGIIPLINTPGHMDAILDAMTELGVQNAAYGTIWNKSGRTIDVTNEDAKAFTYAFVEKYIQYFAGKGCTVFNMGADEYANDVFTSDGMGFGQLQSQGQYGAFVEYVNGMASQIRSAGMRPMAFNDGIYYNRDTASGTFDSDILIAYWSSGWGGYNVASASFLAGQGFDLVNTNGDYYWIVGKDSCTAEKAAEFDINSFMGESSPMDAAGAMFCIWCDYPQNMTEQAVVSETADVITAFGKAISGGETTEPGEPEEPEEGTASDEATGITVTGAGLTSVMVEEVAEAPEIDGMAKTVAYDVTPYAGDEAYTGEATVSVPVPEGWDTSLLHAYVQEADGSYVEVSGAYADGKYTYTAPHFSVQVLAEAAKAAENTQHVEVNAGSSITITVPGVDLTDSVDSSTLDTGIATVDVQAKESVAENNWQLVTNGAAGIVSGEQYLIVSGNSGSQYALTSGGGASQVSISDGKIESAPSGTVFTLVQNGNGYSLRDNNGRYLYPTATRGYIRWTYSLETNQNSAQAVTINGSNSVTISRSVESGWNSTTSYISYSAPTSGWWGSDADYNASSSPSNLYLFHKVETEAGINTEITISGVSEGETSVTIGDTRYEIAVIAEDLSHVEPLTVEYWITNGTVTAENATEKQIAAVDAYGKEGVLISGLVPPTGVRSDADNEVVYWKTTCLDADHHQVIQGDNRTLQGTDFTYIRYWGGEWQYYAVDDQEWYSVRNDDQIVAYYLQVTDVTKEITTNVVDWGQTYYEWSETEDNRWFWDGYVENGSKYVFLDFAVVYEDGTQNPDAFPVDNTMFFHFDGNNEQNPRVLGAISFTENEEFEIWKVTVQDGTSTGYQSPDHFTPTYSEEEEIVWSEDMGGDPHIDELKYYANRSGKLVKIYVRAKVTEDSLTVHYIDQNAGNHEFYNYNIAVKEGTTFDIDFGLGIEKNTLVHNTVINSKDVEQTVTADLSRMTEIGTQYRYSDYTCVEAERSQDGKEVFLYYTFTNTHSFVVDFGLPLNITLNDLGIAGDWQDTAIRGAEYGTAKIQNGTIIYTPSAILPSVETLQLTLTGSSGSFTHQIYIYPATNVYYEEGFASYSDGWTGYSKGSGTQQTAAPGAENANQYGYDGKYANESNGASNGTQAVSKAYGDSAEFTFTGTGIDIYTNSTSASGRLFATVTNDAGSIVKVVQVETALKDGTTGATTGQAVNGYNVPVISLDLGTRDSYTVKLTHMKTTAEDESDTVSIDGYRVYGTLEGDRPAYASDGEANPTYVELRDQVLAALSVDTSESQYADQIAENMLSQVYSNTGTTAGAVVLSQYPYTEGNAQDLLDNGPKNELYLRAGECVVFSVTGSVQVGMKALNADVNYTMNGTAADLTSSTDMYYKVDGSNVAITNNSGGILAITKVKVLGGTGTFAELTKADLMPALLSLGFESESEEPVYADATANIILTDAAGSELASTALTANGVAGETHTFAAADIQTAAESILPEGYELTGEAPDVEVAYGESETVELQAEDTTAEEPDDGEDDNGGSFFEKLGNTVKKVVNTVVDAVTGFFGSLFR